MSCYAWGAPPHPLRRQPLFTMHTVHSSLQRQPFFTMRSAHSSLRAKRASKYIEPRHESDINPASESPPKNAPSSPFPRRKARQGRHLKPCFLSPVRSLRVSLCSLATPTRVTGFNSAHLRLATFQHQTFKSRQTTTKKNPASESSTGGVDEKRLCNVPITFPFPGVV